jgi:hypothetical protein
LHRWKFYFYENCAHGLAAVKSRFFTRKAPAALELF